MVKDYLLSGSIHMKFKKRQNSSDRKQISDLLGSVLVAETDWPQEDMRKMLGMDRSVLKLLSGAGFMTAYIY